MHSDPAWGRQWMHVVVDEAGTVASAFAAPCFFEATAEAKRLKARLETVHGFVPEVGSLFAERRR